MTVEAAKVTYDHGPVGEFFKALFTLGAYKIRDTVYIKCGHCRSKFSGTVKDYQNYLKCPACLNTNIWD